MMYVHNGGKACGRRRWGRFRPTGARDSRGDLARNHPSNWGGSAGGGSAGAATRRFSWCGRRATPNPRTVQQNHPALGFEGRIEARSVRGACRVARRKRLASRLGVQAGPLCAGRPILRTPAFDGATNGTGTSRPRSRYQSGGAPERFLRGALAVRRNRGRKAGSCARRTPRPEWSGAVATWEGRREVPSSGSAVSAGRENSLEAPLCEGRASRSLTRERRLSLPLIFLSFISTRLRFGDAPTGRSLRLTLAPAAHGPVTRVRPCSRMA